jgi:hypothetical protein
MGSNAEDQAMVAKHPSNKVSAFEPSSNSGMNRVTTAAKHPPTNRANTLSVAKHLPEAKQPNNR